MKTIIIAIIALLLASVSGQQKEVFFKTKKMKSGRLVLEPIESNFSTDGKQEGFLWLNNEYFKEILCPIEKQVFTDEQFEFMCGRKNKVYFSYCFDMAGNFLSVKFYINEEALGIISEKDLYRLYSLLKQIKLDTSRWGNIDPRYLDKDNKFDFIIASFPIAYHCGFCLENEE